MDSHHLVIDTSAYHIIMSDATLFTKLKVSHGDVKGVGGSPTSIKSTGMYTIVLLSDKSNCTPITLGAVNVMTSLYSWLPPQWLVSQMKKAASWSII